MAEAPEPRKAASEMSDAEFKAAVLGLLDGFNTRLDGFNTRLDRFEAFAFRTGMDLADLKGRMEGLEGRMEGLEGRMGTFEANQERDHQELMKLVRRSEGNTKP